MKDADKKTDRAILATLKSAYKHLSEHFVAYLKVYFATALLFLALLAFYALISLSFFAIAQALHLTLLYFLLVPLLLTCLFSMIYLSSWCGLVTIDSIVGKVETPLKERFISIRPHAMGFFRYNLLFSLFMFGLIPLGILSLGAVFIFWTVVSSFAGFVYLQHKPKGLDGLWISLQMMKGQFLNLVIFILIVYGVVFAIDSILLQSDNFINSLTSWIINLIAGAYFLTIKYEMYKKIPYPKSVEVSKNWLLASKIGFIVSIVVLFGIINLAVKSYPNWDQIQKNIPYQMSVDELI